MLWQAMGIPGQLVKLKGQARARTKVTKAQLAMGKPAAQGRGKGKAGDPKGRHQRQARKGQRGHPAQGWQRQRGLYG